MNIEIDQQQKFTDAFDKLVEDASPKFKSRWNHEIHFVNPTRKKIIPAFGPGIIDALSVSQREKFEKLRDKYYSKIL